MSVSTYDPEVMLVLDIIDNADGTSVIDGPESFTGSIELDSVKLPANRDCTIRLFSPAGFIKMGPWNPPDETKVYGKYEILLND